MSGAFTYVHSMPPRTPPPANEAAQFERFKEVARELGCDEDEEAFDRALAQIAKSPPVKHVPKKQKNPRRKTGP